MKQVYNINKLYFLRVYFTVQICQNFVNFNVMRKNAALNNLVFKYFWCHPVQNFTHPEYIHPSITEISSENVCFSEIMSVNVSMVWMNFFF